MPKRIKEQPEFGKRLAAIRKARGFSQYSLADALGVTRRVILYYENETPNPPAELLVDLSKALEVSVEELLGIEDNRPEAVADGRSLDGKFYRKWQQLGDEQKKAVLKVVDTFLEPVHT